MQVYEWMDYQRFIFGECVLETWTCTTARVNSEPKRS